jgi:hypothetical protein
MGRHALHLKGTGNPAHIYHGFPQSFVENAAKQWLKPDHDRFLSHPFQFIIH